MEAPLQNNLETTLPNATQAASAGTGTKKRGPKPGGKKRGRKQISGNVVRVILNDETYKMLQEVHQMIVSTYSIELSVDKLVALLVTRENLDSLSESIKPSLDKVEQLRLQLQEELAKINAKV